MSEERGWLGFCVGIAAGIIIVSSVCLVFLGDKWIIMSGIAIGTFILSLVCMNYLTSKSKKEAKEISFIKNKIDEIEKGINGLRLKYLFSLFNGREISRSDKKRLEKFLKDDPDLRWVQDAKILKLRDNKTIRISKGENSVEIKIEEDKATLKISNCRTLNLKVKTENLKRKIYGLKGKMEVDGSIDCLIDFLKSLSKMVDEDDSLSCKEIIEKLKNLKEEIEELNNDSQPFKEKKKKLNEIFKSLKIYIVLISTHEGILLSEINKAIDECEKNIGLLETDKEKNADAIVDSRKKKIKLRDEKRELLSKEPEGVLDKHEIRRSLTITLTIVYFMLLFFSIFSPVTTTTQFINMTGMSPENIAGNITVGNIDSIATKVNIPSSNITFSDIILSRKTAHTTPNLESPFIEVFTYIYLAVIAFYFGSRAIETYITKKK